ncbi:MAG: hypothetical protein QXS19_09125 [Candidatus Methanomethylicia archaeon]
MRPMMDITAIITAVIIILIGDASIFSNRSDNNLNIRATTADEHIMAIPIKYFFIR